MSGRPGTVAVDFDGVIHAYSKGWQDGNVDELAVFAKVFRVELADMLRPMSLPAARKASA